jgi:hypothetical protein
METYLQPLAAPRTPRDPSDVYGRLPAEPRHQRPITPFDRWLQAELSRVHEAALREPVPEELLRLINDPVEGRG